MGFEPTLVAARYLGPAFLRSLSRSWRYRELDDDGNPRKARHYASTAVYALWHAQLLPLTLRHLDQNIAVMISQHRDGEIISRMIAPLGFFPVRGSSTRRGSEALREVVAAGREGHPLAFTTDGPQGPARECKPGVIRAASVLGWPIIPTGAAAARAWRFRSWDEFELPKPGSLVYLRYGDPIAIPPDLERDDTPSWQARVGSAIDAATEACRAAVQAASARSARP